MLSTVLKPPDEVLAKALEKTLSVLGTQESVVYLQLAGHKASVFAATYQTCFLIAPNLDQQAE